MHARNILFLALALLAPTAASAQLEGKLYLDKAEFQTGEPVYLYFDLTNRGPEPMQFVSADSYSACSGFRIELANNQTANGSTCSLLGSAGSCISGARTIAPGETKQDKLLLNYGHDLSQAGFYDFRVSRTLKYGPAGTSLVNLTNGLEIKTDAVLHLRIDDGATEFLRTVFQPYVAELHSKDPEHQREAARAIGTLAPSFLEDTILSMATSSITWQFGFLRMRHLNTIRSREALAAIIQNTPSYSPQKDQAIKYLSEMGDKTYFPLLLELAKAQEPNQARDYVMAAARLGGDQALPYLTSLLRSTNSFSQANGVIALPETGSRSAVPILIALLQDSSIDVERLASIGLIRITHRSPLPSGQWFSSSPSNDYPNWTQWWRVHGNSSPVFDSGQCGAIEPVD